MTKTFGAAQSGSQKRENVCLKPASPCVHHSRADAVVQDEFPDRRSSAQYFPPVLSRCVTVWFFSSSLVRLSPPSPPFFFLNSLLSLHLQRPSSSRYRPHRGVLRLSLRRLRTDHGATASPPEHRDHAAHRQDDRGGKTL